MEQLLFGNLATESVSANLAGGELSWPIIKAGSKLKIGWRPVLLVGGELTEIERAVTAMRASIGVLDESATVGEFSISIDGTSRVFTAAGATLTSAGHPFANDDRVFVTTTVTLPANLPPDCLLHIVGAAGDDFGLALSQGGAAIVTGDAGTGVHSIEQVTTAVQWNDDAAAFTIAINSHRDVGAGQTFQAATVELVDRSWLVKFGKELNPVPLTIRFNRLRPISFVNIRTNQQDAIITHEFRMVQAPIAFSDDESKEIHNAPVITELQSGASGAQEIPEIQKVVFDPLFRGTYNLEVFGRKTGLLSRDDGPAEFQSALNADIAIAEDDEVFTVTNPLPQQGHIFFDGSLAGIDQPLITVNPIDGPVGDSYVTIDLETFEAQALLRAAGLDVDDQITLELAVEVEYDDPDNGAKSITWTYQTQVIVRRELISPEIATAISIDFLRKYDPTSYIPFTSDQTTVGNKGAAVDFGEFVITNIVHNLNTPQVMVMVVTRSGTIEPLILGTDYDIEFDSDDDLTVTLKGAFDPAPGVDTLGLFLYAIDDTSAFDPHTHTQAQIVGLVARLAAIEAAIDALELLAPSGVLTTQDPTVTVVGFWALPTLIEVYPLREADANLIPESNDIDDIDISLLPENRLSAGLLPAVHDAATEALPDPPPDPDVSQQGKVFENLGATDILIFGGVGHRGATIAPGEFAASDGRLFYKVNNFGAETSYYPITFDRTLFEIVTNDEQLRLKKEFFLDIAFKLRMINSDTSASMVFVIEQGTFPEESVPAVTGPNLEDVVYDTALPILTQKIIVMPVAGIHRFGVRVKRELIATVDTITCDQLKYGAASAGDNTPADANFAIRGRLVRFDTENSELNAKGMIAISGPDAEIPGEAVSSTLGIATII